MSEVHALRQRIEELEQAVHTLEKDLIHDALTGLKTKAFFEEEARVYFDAVLNLSAERQARRQGWFGFKNASFIFIDIDHFKKINDTYGHGCGDDVLKKVAKTIKENVREGDTPARWGGEEIVVTLVGATERDATEKAEGIRKEIEKLTFDDMPDLRVTASAGVASAGEGLAFEDVLKRADEALYKAKQSGRNQVIAYSSLHN